jgi:hypothetical protein
MRSAFQQALKGAPGMDLGRAQHCLQQLQQKMQGLKQLDLVLLSPRPRWDAEGHDEQAWLGMLFDIGECMRKIRPFLSCISVTHGLQCI